MPSPGSTQIFIASGSGYPRLDQAMPVDDAAIRLAVRAGQVPARKLLVADVLDHAQAPLLRPRGSLRRRPAKDIWLALALDSIGEIGCGIVTLGIALDHLPEHIVVHDDAPGPGMLADK